MAKRGRRSHRDKPVEWAISLPESLANEVDLLLSNPLTGKPVYGAKSKIVTAALKEWRAKHTGKELTVCPNCGELTTKALTALSIMVQSCLDCPFRGETHTGAPSCRKGNPHRVITWVPDNGSPHNKVPQWCPLKGE